MKNSFYINSNLITNFKPNILKDYNYVGYMKKNTNQKFCKNFLLYLLLFKYKNKFFKKSNIFIKKYKKNVFTILRSPYRHKLARHQIFLKRYKIKFTILIKLKKDVKIVNFNKLLKLVVFLKKFNNVFESNLIYINNVKINIPLKYNNFFIKK